MKIVTGQAVRVPINGTYINARVDGPENAPWMVFSNSLTSNLSIWDEQVIAFSGRFKFLRYDQRGHGGSDSPAGPFTMNDLANDLLDLLAHFSVDKAVLVGVSMGASTILRCAFREPSRCLAIVPCDGNWRSAPGAAAMWAERLSIVKRGGMAAIAEPTVRRWFQPDFFERKPEIVARIKNIIAGTSQTGYFGCAGALQDYDFSSDYPDIATPGLFIAGAQDGDAPKVMREMASAVQRGQYYSIDNCGHLPNIEQPYEWFKAVDEFVRDLKIGEDKTAVKDRV